MRAVGGGTLLTAFGNVVRLVHTVSNWRNLWALMGCSIREAWLAFQAAGSLFAMAHLLAANTPASPPFKLSPLGLALV